MSKPVCAQQPLTFGWVPIRDDTFRADTLIECCRVGACAAASEMPRQQVRPVCWLQQLAAKQQVSKNLWYSGE